MSGGGVGPAGGGADRDSGGCEERPGRTPPPAAAASQPGGLEALLCPGVGEAEGVGDAVRTRGTAGTWQGPPSLSESAAGLHPPGERPVPVRAARTGTGLCLARARP